MAKKVRHKKDPATRKQCRLISQLQTELAIKDGKLPANMKAVDKIQNAKDIENALVNAGHLTKGMASEAIVNMKKQLENKKQEKKKRQGPKTFNKWTKKEEKTLTQLFLVEGLSYSEAAKKMGRSLSSVKNKCHSLKLYKNATEEPKTQQSLDEKYVLELIRSEIKRFEKEFRKDMEQQLKATQLDDKKDVVKPSKAEDSENPMVRHEPTESLLETLDRLKNHLLLDYVKGELDG